MNAEFYTTAGQKFRISLEPVTPEVNPSNRHVEFVLIDAPTIHRVFLKRSEARAIASALMGAAAEL